ncbi:ABC transporter transmembrane domain-containing protein [Sedimentitalea sp.]|uniref:ABC transporter transmembrane domain-containing protein n=1 Tax=Sedimentitalea sp. TaxID=2048915 RepID=UPI003298AD78
MFGFIWKYSKRDQLVLLVVTSLLFPLLYLTLELPKRIINDAIGAQSSVVDVFGMQISQVMFLWLLCGAFLLAVLCHGLLKMRINTMKGILSERMLRRFRFQMISRIMRFPQPYFERVSQGELVSMVTAESEPMGGLMGDAISQPVLQAGQMLTILGFLFLQSFWFGLAAVALIPLQAWLIPKLQREINLLNKDRIKEVRALASMIGESAAGASTLRSNGGWRYRMAEITGQLGRLFDIRFLIYQKKFFMKFLNNFITQLTPFFFFSVGGYLVLQGSVSLGALVAALAAYKDLSSPWKELLAYYNQTQDMAVRWDVILERFAPDGMVSETLFVDPPEKIPHLRGDFVFDRVTVHDVDGNTVLEDISATFPAGSVVGITASSAEDRRVMAELMIREFVPSSGKITIGDKDLSTLHQAVIATRIGYANSQPVLFRGTFGENVMMPVMAEPHGQDTDEARLREAIRAGNSSDPFGVDWMTPSIAELEDLQGLRDWWLKLIEGTGSESDLFRRGVEQRFDAKDHPELAKRLIELRPTVQAAVHDADLDKYVFLFDPKRYNPGLPVGENLLYATPRVQITQELLAKETDFLAQLKALRLDQDLLTLSRDVLDLLRRTFGLDGTDHPLFRKLGLNVKTYETAVELVERTRKGGTDKLTPAELSILLTVPFQITAEQLGPAFPDEIKARILELRQSQSQNMIKVLGDLFAPLDSEQFVPGRTVIENALFGKISETAGGKADEVHDLVTKVLAENGAEQLVVELIYDLDIGLGGANLPALLAEPLAFSRAAIKRPDILILNKALASYDIATQVGVHKKLRDLLPESTLIYLNDSFEREDVFDHHFELKQGRMVSDDMELDSEVESAGGADLARKLRALEETDMFAGLNRKQLRLLAFGARWYTATKGEVVFNKGDAPKDGAYVLINGTADLFQPRSDDKDELIATVGPGALVGELGLIRDEPRALSMVATSDLKCLRVGAEEFLAVVENDAATAFKLLQVVAGYVNS